MILIVKTVPKPRVGKFPEVLPEREKIARIWTNVLDMERSGIFCKMLATRYNSKYFN